MRAIVRASTFDGENPVIVSILRSMLTFAVGALVVLAPTSPPDPAYAADPARYVSGGTIAARVNGGATVDEGYVVCDDESGTGAGGFCVPFGGGDAVWIDDEAAGEDVAFQVCVDNSGDGICTSPDFGPCADTVVFSHHDDGSFFNPVGPVPTGFAPGCGAGAYDGYVVFLCEGVHAFDGSVHSHPATTGTGGVTTGGEGTGNFCGGNPQPSRKAYVHELPGITAATTRIDITVGCYGCGVYGPAGNSLDWACDAACVFDGEPCVGCTGYGSFTIMSGADASCTLSATLDGTIQRPYGEREFTMTIVGGIWTMSVAGDETSSGVVATREPVGIPCGGPVKMTLVGGTA